MSDSNRLDVLPKGSRCTDYKSVPSRSSYHKSDNVDRCANFSTTGKKGDGETKPDGHDPSEPEPDSETEEWRGINLPKKHAGYTLEDTEHKEVTYVGLNPQIDPERPTKTHRVVKLRFQTRHKGTDGWELQYGTRDVNGNTITPGDPSNNDEWDISGKYGSNFGDVKELGVDELLQLLEVYDAGPRDFSYAPESGSLTVENRIVLYHLRAMKRGPVNTELAFSDGEIEFVASNPDNTVAYFGRSDTSVGNGPGFPAGKARVPFEPLYDYVNDGNLTDTLTLSVEQSPEENAPPYLGISVNGDEQTEGLRRAWLLPPVDRDPSLRDQLDKIEEMVETTIHDHPANDYKKLVKASELVPPSSGAIQIIASGERDTRVKKIDSTDAAQIRSEGDVDTFKGRFTDPKVSGPKNATAVNPDYLKMTRYPPRPASNEVTIEFTCDAPIIVSYPLEGRDDAGDGDMVEFGESKWLIAPRITAEGLCGKSFDLSEGQSVHELQEQADTCLLFQPTND